MKEHINFKDSRVIAALTEAKKKRGMSKLVETAIIFYLDNLQSSQLTREDVKDIVIQCLASAAFTTDKINIKTSDENIKDDINDIMNL